MPRLDTIEAGHDRAVDELLFLTGLLVEFGCRVEVLTQRPMTLGFSDIFRSPTFRADDFIGVEKASEDLLERLAALRILANKFVLHLVETANRHGESPMPDGWQDDWEELLSKTTTKADRTLLHTAND